MLCSVATTLAVTSFADDPKRMWPAPIASSL